jgi:hypothetical protein
MGIPVVLIPRQTMYWRFQGYLDFGWNLDDVCWDQPIPKVSQDFIRGVSQSFRKVIQAFIQS